MGLDMMLYRKQESGDVEVGYWRKANAVHHWFVMNVQGGVDECQPSDVSREKMQELLETCRKVLDLARVSEGEVVVGKRYRGEEWENITERGFLVDNPEVCEELLPSTEGFFFGSQDYDEYYLESVKRTIEILERALADEQAEHYYQASW
jgi:hypothetical protein